MRYGPWEKFACFFSALIVIGFSIAHADMEQLKNYKTAFPDEKPKCISCHVDTMPKKEAGKHELNAYGQKVIQISAKPTVETYKTAGK